MLAVVSAPVASAQSLGSVRFQTAPYCNVLTLNVTQSGSVYTLDGFDDQCGAGTRAAAAGTAFLNPDGSIGIGLTLVLTPGGSPIHVGVSLSSVTLSGTWRDSGGNTGTFVFNPPLPAPGAPRPTAGGLGGVAVTSLVPGAGLFASGGTGSVNLSLAFGGSGGAASVARSDHHHGLVNSNTSVGESALASLTTGPFNTAIGTRALVDNTTGVGNTAVGYRTLDRNTLGEHNAALGYFALGTNSAGDQNVAVGASALGQGLSSNNNVAVGYRALTSASFPNQNTAIGDAALESLESGNGNVALGASAGSDLTFGSNNVYIGTSGEVASENDTIRIGDPSGFLAKEAAYMGGIYNRNVSGATDQPVLIDSSGKLGTNASSARVKQDIENLVDLTPLQHLRPVSFRYRPDQNRGDALQYGLLAEEVADVMPSLVIRDEQGEPLSVRYHVLIPLLLAEVQRLERERAALEQRLNELSARLTREGR
jgi:hypothetical protein